MAGYLVKSPLTSPEATTRRSAANKIHEDISNFLNDSKSSKSTSLNVSYSYSQRSFDTSDIPLVDYSDSDDEPAATPYHFRNSLEDRSSDSCNFTTRNNRFTRQMRAALDDIDSDSRNSASRSSDTETESQADHSHEFVFRQRMNGSRNCSRNTATNVSVSSRSSKLRAQNKTVGSSFSSPTKTVASNVAEREETTKRYHEAYVIENFLQQKFSETAVSRSPTRNSGRQRASIGSPSLSPNIIVSEQSTPNILNTTNVLIPETFKKTISRIKHYEDELNKIKDHRHAAPPVNRQPLTVYDTSHAEVKHKHSANLLEALGNLVVTQREAEKELNLEKERIQLLADFNVFLKKVGDNYADLSGAFPAPTQQLSKDLNTVKDRTAELLTRQVLASFSKTLDRLIDKLRETREAARLEADRLEQEAKQQAELEAKKAAEEASRIAKEKADELAKQKAAEEASKPTATTPPESIPAVTTPAAPAAPGSKKPGRKEKMQALCRDKYTERVTLFNTTKAQIQSRKIDPKLKLALRTTLTTCVVNMGARSGTKLKKQVDQIISIFRDRQLVTAMGESIPLGDNVIVAAYTATDALLNQAKKSLGKQNQVTDGYVLGLAITAIWSASPEFGQLLLAMLTKQCPWIVPYYEPTPLPGQSERDYFELAGWNYDKNGQMEKPADHYGRMEGLFRVYVSTCQSPMPPGSDGKTHPNGLCQLWNWLALTLNGTPCVGYSARFLIICLEQGGYAMYLHYTKHYYMILTRIQKAFLPQLQKQKEDEALCAKLNDVVTDQISIIRDTTGQKRFSKPMLVVKDEFGNSKEIVLGSNFWGEKGDTGIAGEKLD